jgi:hypothetical protein
MWGSCSCGVHVHVRFMFMWGSCLCGVHVYVGFMRPVLEYGDVVWGNCTKKKSDLLESVQIEADRIITGLRCNSSRQKLYHGERDKTIIKRTCSGKRWMECIIFIS